MAKGPKLPIIVKSDIPAAAKAASRKLPSDRDILFGKNEGEFDWENAEHVMRMLLLFDAYHDFGDSARAKSAVPGDVYLRKPITNFPGCPGVWTVLEIMVGAGLSAISDVEGELRKILTTNCPQLFTGVDVLKNITNVYYDARTEIPTLDKLPSQFDIEKEHPKFKELIETMVAASGRSTKDQYYYADAGPGIGEKLQNGCGMRTTVLDSATASDKLSIDPPCSLDTPHVFGLFNLPMKGKTVISLSGTLRNGDFAYNVSNNDKALPPQNLAGKTSGPSLPFLANFIRDDYLKQIILTGGPKNGLERTYLAKNKIDLKDSEYKMFEVFKFLSDNSWSRTDLDNYAYNVKTSADYEQPREASATGLIVGGTVDGEEALQILLNKHISLYKHTVNGKSSVTVFNVPVGNVNSADIARVNASRTYVSVVKEYNFYVNCCNQFEMLRTTKESTLKDIDDELNKFYSFVDGIPADPLVLKLAKYVGKMFVSQLKYDIQRTELPIVPFAVHTIPEDVPAEITTESIVERSAQMQAEILRIDAENFRIVTKVLQNNNITPHAKVRKFFNQALIEYGLVRNPDVPFENIYTDIETLKALSGRRVQKDVRKSIHGVLNESVLKGLFSGVQTLLPWVMKDVTTIKLNASTASDSAPESPGLAAYDVISKELQELLDKPDDAAVIGGAIPDHQAEFVRLYGDLADADERLTGAYNAIPEVAEDSVEVITDEAYDGVMLAYEQAAAAVEDKLLEISREHYKLDLETALETYRIDMGYIPIFMARMRFVSARIVPLVVPRVGEKRLPGYIGMPERPVKKMRLERQTRKNVGVGDKRRRNNDEDEDSPLDWKKQRYLESTRAGGGITHVCPDCAAGRPRRLRTLKKKRAGGEPTVAVEIVRL
jgi:hypothetical protein